MTPNNGGYIYTDFRNPYCDASTKFLTQVKGCGRTASRRPRAGGGDVPELAGPEIFAIYNAPSASVQGRSAGRCRAARRTPR
jgi:hypothetical protein